MGEMTKHRLEIKVILLYFAVILFIIGMYFRTFQFVYMEHEKKIMGEESIATLQTIQTAVSTVIKNANDFSKLVLADEVIQKVMNSGDLFGNIAEQSALNQRIYAQTQFSDMIESVWFIDAKNQILSIGDQSNDFYSIASLSEFNWYQPVLLKSGGYELVVNTQEGAMSISMIRPYKNLENFEIIGFYSINIKIDALRATYLNALDQGSEEIVIMDQENNFICRDGVSILKEEDFAAFSNKIKNMAEDTFMEHIKVNDERYLITGVKIPKEGYSILRILPIDMNRYNTEMLSINIILIVISSALILIGSVIISRAVTVPIQLMLTHMKQAETGEFYKIHEKSFFKEFSILFEGYNLMIEKIELLIRQTIEKQKIIRRVELNEMQEQMKPHFLYNTLDAIDALAMLGENKKVCELVQALGDFYRKSVSKGRDMLTVAEEIKIVEDYIDIMKIRFSDTFEEKITMDETALNYLLPKLTIQPLVENVFQHGIREKEEIGHIFIGATMDKTILHVWVMDDGNGIPTDVVEHIKNKSNKKEEQTSFGLRGTIERMQLIYEDRFTYRIENGEFTEIHFYVDMNEN